MQAGHKGVTLEAFLAARLDEDEAAAKATLNWPRLPPTLDDWQSVNLQLLHWVAASRAILAAYQLNGQGVAYTLEAGLEFALCALAAVYRDHPDYNPAWNQAPPPG